jgi:hypothetical protein
MARGELAGADGEIRTADSFPTASRERSGDAGYSEDAAARRLRERRPMRGNAARPVSAPTLCIMQESDQERLGLAAMLLVQCVRAATRLRHARVHGKERRRTTDSGDSSHPKPRAGAMQLEVRHQATTGHCGIPTTNG